MSRAGSKPQPDEPYYVKMARQFPTIYRLPTQDELAAALALRAKPITGMRFSIDQHVRHYFTRLTGVIENCTMLDDGRFQYTVEWSDGRRTLVYETDLREAVE